jgi:hypothetical protein
MQGGDPGVTFIAGVSGGTRTERWINGVESYLAIRARVNVLRGSGDGRQG